MNQVRLDGDPVGAAAVGEEPHLEPLALEGREGRLEARDQAVLAEGLEQAHARHQVGEPLEGDDVRLHQPAVAVEPQRHEGQVLEHLAAPALGRLGGPHRLAGVGIGHDGESALAPEPHEGDPRDQERDERDGQEDDGHGGSLADPRERRARSIVRTRHIVISFPAVNRAPLLAALACLLAGPSLALAGPVAALPPAKPRAITEVAPGIGFQRAVQANGQVLDVLRAAPSPRVSLAPVQPGGSPVTRGLLTSAVAARLNSGAVAGINGDFFNLTTNQPSGVLMINGELIRDPEASRSSLVMLPAGAIGVLKLAFQGRFQAIDPTGAVTYPQRTILGVNRPPQRAAETLLYTSGYGVATTPTGPSRYEISIRLDTAGPVLAGQTRTGTVVAAGSGGGTPIGAGNVVISGVGSSGPRLVSGFPLGQAVSFTPAILSLPAGAVNAIGSGPALVQNGRAIRSAGEGFTNSQLGARTARSAIGQAADGTTLFVTVEGPQQGSPGMTVAEQANLMRSLGAVTAIATDAGGSAQLAVRNQLMIPWAQPRALADVVVMSYQGITVQPLPFRVSPNGDGVDDTARVVFRSPLSGPTKVSVARTTGRPARRIWQGTLGPGTARVRLNPKRLRFADGPYIVVATQTAADGSVSEQRRRVIFDRTIGFLTARPTTTRVRRKVVPRLDIGFRLTRKARVTVRIRTRGGTPITTLVSGRTLRPGRQRISWNRKVKGAIVSGRVQVTAESRTSFGTSGLVRSVTLATPPKPKPSRKPAPKTP